MLAVDLKTGVIFKENNTPFQVMKYEHVKSARGGAVVKVRAKNLLNSSVMEKGYNAGASIEGADIVRKNAQYLYKSGEKHVFMDTGTFEQFESSESLLGDSSRFLSEGITVQVLYFEDRPISIDLPIMMDFEVTYTEPGYKGNTVSNVYKEATLSNNAVVKVPAFVRIGDRIKVDTRTGEYSSKS